MPLFYVRKEVFEWLKQGKKTVDVRRGKPMRGDCAVFQCGPQVLRLPIVGRESGQLAEVVRLDNFLWVVPVASCLGDALAYLQGLYPGYGGVFSAYHVEVCKR